MASTRQTLRALTHLLLISTLLVCSIGCSQPDLREKPSNALAATYSEQHRPQLHFSPPTMWMNDPNGMVYYDGEYHLFYQYYPQDTVWGPMHWGHAVSTDLLHWRHLPIALYPDALGYIFSGSAVVDWNNSSGFGSDDTPPLVAIYTYHNPQLAEQGGKKHEYQGIAYSTDRGRTWTKYAGNPVLPNTQSLQDFRDPKVFWHEDSDKWVMSLSAGDHVQFWGSEDLKNWQHLSDFGRGWGAHDGVWECPDLVEMRVVGSDESRWVLIQNLNPGGPQGGSGTQYFVGNFDGFVFALDESFEKTLDAEGAVWLDAGKDNYAGVTWANVPEEDGRTLFIGWMGNWEYAQQVPTHPWRSAMTLPRELTLHNADRGYRVHSRPVRELNGLRGPGRRIGPHSIDASAPLALNTDFPITPSEVFLEFEMPESGGYELTVELSNEFGERYRFGYDGVSNQFYSDRSAAGDSSFSETFAGIHRTRRQSQSNRLRLRLILDVASIEAFADDGADVMTELYFPSQVYDRITIRASGRGVLLADGTVYPLKSVWK